MKEVTDQNFQEEVLLSKGLVLVDYAASWCAPCQHLKPVLEDIGQVFAGKVKIVQMDVDNNHEFPSKYGVRALPTLMLFCDGEDIDVRVGAMNRKQLVEWLESHAEVVASEMEHD